MSAWFILLIAWSSFMAGMIVMALARMAAEHVLQPDPETRVHHSDLELGGGTESPTVPTAPAPHPGPAT